MPEDGAALEESVLLGAVVEDGDVVVDDGVDVEDESVLLGAATGALWLLGWAVVGAFMTGSVRPGVTVVLLGVVAGEAVVPGDVSGDVLVAWA